MKKDERLEQILKHAARVFYDKGYDRASIRDIAKEAEMSLAGLYYYFRSKEQLLFLIQKHVFSHLIEEVNRKVEGISEPVEKLRVFIRNHLDYFIRNLVEMKVLSHEYEALKGEYHEGIAALRRDYYRVAEGIVAEILDRRDDRVEARVAVLGLFGMMNWIYTWYRADTDGGADRLAEQITRLYLGGLLGEKT